MPSPQYDITYEDLNPTYLFSMKGTRTRTEQNYHCHEFVEIAFIMSGNGHYRINGEIHPICEGDILILNPGDYHQAIVDHSSGPTVETFIGLQDFGFKNAEYNHVPKKNNQSILHTEKETREKLFRLFRSINIETVSTEPGRCFMMKSYLIQLLLLLYRAQFGAEKNTSGETDFSSNKICLADQIVNYIDDHYNEKISLEHMAKNMYISPFYISKIFKSETGDTPINHLIKVRMEKAKQMLQSDESTSVQDIASFVGYEDAYHFSKLFKKHYGVSPSKYRKSS